MVTLNDYLYSGYPLLQIMHTYSEDLRKAGLANHNAIDVAHSNFLIRQIELLEHNEFLSSQSQRILEFYNFISEKYPFLSFTFKGRIKSLIRTENKYNAYIVQKIYKYYKKHGEYPKVSQLKKSLTFFRDLIAYRIVVSMPATYNTNEKYREKEEIRFLYEIANALPEFLEERGFSVEISESDTSKASYLLNEEVAPYYRDYVEHVGEDGYQSLHITVYDNIARCHLEVQLRTKDMDDYAEIGPANHLGYEKRQQLERSKRNEIPEGECIYFDEAYQRGLMLQKVDLTKVKVDMFTAYSDSLINDGCGLYKGRLILPFEHLPRYTQDKFY